MNRDDIIRMAKQASGSEWSIFQDFMQELERFAELVAAAEREACQRVHDLLEVHQAALEASEKPGPWPAKEVIDKAVAAEREACALLCDNLREEWGWDNDGEIAARDCANAIRERGEQQTPQERTPDYLEKCPNCNGPADNGFDRSWPDPNPYFCTKCMKAMEY